RRQDGRRGADGGPHGSTRLRLHVNRDSRLRGARPRLPDGGPGRLQGQDELSPSGAPRVRPPGRRWWAAARGRRSLLVLVLSLAWAVHADGQAPPGRLAFDGQILVFAWQGGNPGETVREYLPAGEKLESWTKLASIREYPKLDDPRASAVNL